METPNEGSRSGNAGTARSSRRAVLAGLGATALASLAGTGSGTTRSTDPWRLVALPDTQGYVGTGPFDGELHTDIAHTQTQWIADTADESNVAFVSHEGDVVSVGTNEAEFERMDAVMGRLDGVVPYSACVGDHDYHVQQARFSGAETWKRYFGRSRYEGYDWFGGADPSGRNLFQRFEAGRYEFLHIALEYEPPGSPSDPTTPVGWVQSVLDANPDTPAILTTHAYLSDGVEGRYTVNEEFSGQGLTGQELWEALVRPNDQIFMVLGGNFHDRGFLLWDQPRDDGEYHQVSENAAGSDVYEMLANYQDWPSNGNGWLRDIAFVPGGGSGSSDRIRVETYSPHLDEYQTTSESQFHFDLDFAERFSDFDRSAGSPGGNGSGDGDDGSWLPDHWF